MKSALPDWRLRQRSLNPVVQGGMGVGISAHRLAGSVARLGALGTISSVDLRHHHADLLEQTKNCRHRDQLDRVNLIALDREIRMALALADGNGAIAVNVMKAVAAHAAYVRQSCESGAHAIVMGAGLPLDLPDLTRDFPEVALIPILSDLRGTAIVLKKWLRKNRLPDAIVIEHPRYAGGHLGATRPEEINDARFDFDPVLTGIFELMEELGIAQERIPLIAAGGINSPEQVRLLLALGAAAVQVGTPFAVTEKGDAHPNFKQVLAAAEPADIVTFMSVAGLPVRAARRHCPGRTVPHRHPAGLCPQGRRQKGTVFSRLGAPAVRDCDPPLGGTDRLPADREQAGNRIAACIRAGGFSV